MPASGLLQPGTRRRLLTLPACIAVLQVCGISYGLWMALHYIKSHIAKQPMVVLLFPLLSITSLALVLPLLMFLSFQADFPGLNPANPLHYVTISRRCYTALGRNNLKVAEKDL